jgi:hypothetical protein
MRSARATRVAAAVCATAVLGVVAVAPAPASDRGTAPAVVAPPASLHDFLVLAGVLPVPGVGELARMTAARCATPEAALESGDCAGTGGSGGGAPLRRIMG